MKSDIQIKAKTSGGNAFTPSPAHRVTPSPSWAMTAALLLALTAFFFTSEVPLIWPFALAILWTHFSSWRYPRDSSAAWLVRLLFYGGIFAFFGGQPGIGADWIFDAKTFNTIGLIAASEAALQAWREPPPNLRFHSLMVLQSGIIFLAACNTYDDRYIRVFAPLYILSTLLALRDIRFGENFTRRAWPFQPRRVLALALVLAGAASLHIGLMKNKSSVEIWALRMMRRRFFDRGGISNQPQLSSTFNLSGSTRRVMRIEGALNAPHLRAAAFDEYSYGRWSPSLDTREKTFFPVPPTPDESTPVVTITKFDKLNNLIFAPLNAVQVVPGEGSSFEWQARLGPIWCEDPVPYSYKVFWSEKGSELGVPLHQGVLCAPPTPAERKRLLTVGPEIDPRVAQLASVITKDAPNEPDKIEAVAEYLITNHKYARTVRRGRGDPVSIFLLEKKNAHCEYFASAAVILLRGAGVPARYATGFLAHESETIGGRIQTVVRSRDAHAWAEAFVDGVGWVTVDATPGEGRPDAQPQVGWFQRTWERLQDEFALLRERMANLGRAQLFGFIVFVVLVWMLEKWRQAKRSAAAIAAREYSTNGELAKLAALFGSVLQKRKIALPEGKPWSESLRSPDAPQEYSEFIERYNRARFGGEISAPEIQHLQKLLKSIEKGNRHDNAADGTNSAKLGTGNNQRNGS